MTAVHTAPILYAPARPYGQQHVPLALPPLSLPGH